jgi:hypothetical protein
MGAIAELLRIKGGRQKTAEGEYSRLVEAEGQGKRLTKGDLEALESCMQALGKTPETFEKDTQSFARRIELEVFVSECDETKLRATYEQALAECTQQKKYDRRVALNKVEYDLSEKFKAASEALGRLTTAQQKLARFKGSQR